MVLFGITSRGTMEAHKEVTQMLHHEDYPPPDIDDWWISKCYPTAFCNARFRQRQL